MKNRLPVNTESARLPGSMNPVRPDHTAVRNGSVTYRDVDVVQTSRPVEVCEVENQALEAAMAHLHQILRRDLGVKEGYAHSEKWVTPADPIRMSGAAFKWYLLAPKNDPVPQEINRLAQAYLARQSLDAKGLGFVILHRCGKSFYFLLVSTWRGNNELWETVFYKDGDEMADFDLFPREGAHKPTFCVWEMAAVLHEKEAWEHFLSSARDGAAAKSWLEDRYTGLA
jgi:hypothetical protein